MILLPKTTKEEADEIIERITQTTKKIKDTKVEISISLGASSKTKESTKMKEIIKKAEDTMYKSKLYKSPSIRRNSIDTILATLYEKDIYSEAHSRNVSRISKEIAIELGMLDKDVKEVETAGLLHDIGKALDQEFEGTHPEIWGILARKYKINPKIVDMIENHHWEQFSISLEAAIVQVADAISSVRPWARREVIEDYLKRVQEMEALVSSFSWVNKAYALSAGREIRVFVDANTISDLEAAEMAKKIADNIQEKLSYPGEVKVNLIREMRVIEVAK